MVIATRTDLDDDDDAFDENGVCKDGHGVRVSVAIMDAQQRRIAFGAFNPRDHQPGFCDAERARKAYADLLRDNGLSPDPDAGANEKAYSEFKASVSNAWRNPSPGRVVWSAPPDDVALAERVASILRLSPESPRAACRPSRPAPMRMLVARRMPGM